MPEVVTRRIGLIDSGRVPLLLSEISGQWLAIDIEIKERASIVGSVDYSKYVPRIWSGYSYLVANQSIVKQKAIEFVRERIYEKRFTPSASLFNRLNAVAGDSYDEIPFDLKNINYNPFEDAHNEQVVFLNNPEVLPNFIEAHPLSEILIYIPVGVEIEVKISSMPYLDGINATLITDTVTGDTSWELAGVPIVGHKPLESVNEDILSSVPAPISFDEFATGNGYISPSGLALACSGAGFSNPLDIMSDAVNDAVSASGGNPSIYQEMLDALLSDSAISQSQLDAILSQNPSFSPKQLLEYLMSSGAVTPSQINRAITKIGNPSPSQSILNNGNFSSVGGQYCMTGKPLRMARDFGGHIEMEYIWSGTLSASCAIYPDNANLNIRMLSSIYSPAKTIYLRKWTGGNNTGNYSLVNVTGSAKIIQAPSFTAYTLGDVVWRRGNITTNTSGTLSSEIDP